jgi:aspartate aminotransferase
MPSSPIRKLVEYAVAAESRGIQIHYLNIGQPDIHSPEAFWEAVNQSGIKTLEYSHSAGISPLRSAVALDYGEKDIPVQPSDVIVTNGGSEATLFAFLTLFDPGDEVVVVEPFYANYAGFAASAGIRLIPLTSRIEDDFTLPKTNDFAAVLTPRTRGILLCNPSNPTGTVYSADQLREIARLAKDRDLFLIVDEVYRDFYYGTEQLLSVLQIEGMEQNAVMIDSASKKFSVCGARVGFLVSKNPEIIEGALKFGQARLSAPTLDQMGVAACLMNTPESYFEAVREEYIGRRNLLVSLLSEIPGVVCPRIDGAFYAMVRLPVRDTDEFAKWLLTDFNDQGETVLLAPASGFYVTPGLGKDEVRIAYVLSQDKLRAAMRCLKRALEVYPGRLQPTAGATAL